MGYRVIAVDIEPETYASIARACGVDSMVKADLERDRLPLDRVGCIVFTEVLEHLNLLLRSTRVLRDKPYP
jgi:hypothetical protein